MKTADQKTRDLWERMQGRFTAAYNGDIIPPLAVAEIVQEIILSEKSEFRYHTNKVFYAGAIKAKFADPTGFKSVDIIAKQFCEEN